MSAFAIRVRTQSPEQNELNHNNWEDMTDQQPWTIKRLLDWTTQFFESKERDSPRLCAEILLAEALKCQRIELYTRFDQVPDDQPMGLYRDWVKRHAKGEPVAYLVGHQEFYSLKFNVNSNVLIPRPETEHLVIAAIDAAKAIGKPQPRILDIGTGSGCVAITLAKQIPGCQVVAVDVSSEALQVAKENIELHDVASQVSLVESDLFQAVADDFRADIIVSNPPYVGHGEVDTVDVSVREYEPSVAVFAGDLGTEIIQRLVQEAPNYLEPGGFLIFETSPVIFDSCLEIAAQSPFAAPETIKDLAGHRRVVQMRSVQTSAVE